MFFFFCHHVYMDSILCLYFVCCIMNAGLLTRIRARLAVVAQRQWHPPCNRKWNRNTLLQINVCFQLCGWLNWQTDSFVLMAYFLFISNVFKWKPLFCSLFFAEMCFWTVAIHASCGLCSRLMLLVVQDTCLKKFVIYWITFYEVL